MYAKPRVVTWHRSTSPLKGNSIVPRFFYLFTA
jgi:hypothetical protein